MTKTVSIHKEIEADGRVFDVTVHVGYEQGDSSGGFSNGGWYVEKWESKQDVAPGSRIESIIEDEVKDLWLEREISDAAWEAKQARAGV